MNIQTGDELMADNNQIGWLVALGLKVPNMLAGAAGGAVNSLYITRVGPLAMVGSIISGALTANYLADMAAGYISHVVEVNELGSAFLVGLGGMAVTQGIVSAIARMIEGIGSKKGD